MPLERFASTCGQIPIEIYFCSKLLAVPLLFPGLGAIFQNILNIAGRDKVIKKKIILSPLTTCLRATTSSYLKTSYFSCF